MVKTPFYDKNGLKKGAWSEEEDNILRAYIQKSGHSNWRKLPKSAGLSRCGKSCRLRWMNYLRPNVKLGNYTEEEDLLITKMHDELGNKWSMIATRLPGRTDNEIKNHWHTYLKNRTMKMSTTSKVKDQSAGKIYHRRDEADQVAIKEAENDICSEPSYQILESFALSPETCPIEFSSSDNKHVSVAEDHSLATLETLEQSFENFWTEPFLMEDTHIQTKYPASMAEEEFSQSPSCFNDGIDLIDQVMRELPENYCRSV